MSSRWPACGHSGPTSPRPPPPEGRGRAAQEASRQLPCQRALGGREASRGHLRQAVCSNAFLLGVGGTFPFERRPLPHVVVNYPTILDDTWRSFKRLEYIPDQ